MASDGAYYQYSFLFQWNETWQGDRYAGLFEFAFAARSLEIARLGKNDDKAQRRKILWSRTSSEWRNKDQQEGGEESDRSARQAVSPWKCRRHRDTGMIGMSKEQSRSPESNESCSLYDSTNPKRSSDAQREIQISPPITTHAFAAGRKTSAPSCPRVVPRGDPYKRKEQPLFHIQQTSRQAEPKPSLFQVYPETYHSVQGLEGSRELEDELREILTNRTAGRSA